MVTKVMDAKKIIRIARRAAKNRGYAVYADYNDYLADLIAEGDLEPVRAGWTLQEIRKALEGAGWYFFEGSGRRPARFYQEKPTDPEKLKEVIEESHPGAQADNTH